MSSHISKASTPPTASSNTLSAGSTSKYLKRADLEADRQTTYHREQEEAAAARDAKSKRKREAEDEEAKRNAAREEKRRRLAEESRLRREREEVEQEKRRRRRLGLPDTPPPPSNTDESTQEQKLLENGGREGEVDAPSEEALTALFRALQEPTFLFGENPASRLARYRSLTNSTTDTINTKKPRLPIPTSLALLPESEIKVPVPATLPTSSTGKHHLVRQLVTYFTLLLREWSLSLSLRDTSVQESYQGKQALAAYTQSLTAMVPLFRKLEHPDTLKPPPTNTTKPKPGSGSSSASNGNQNNNGLPDSILLPLLSIVGAAQERRYVDANDGYLRLSIGKAAWPIGVTMVGIHERSAREKLHEGEGAGKAHVMGDEVTRKYLQAIKRCVSFAQTRWPPEDLGQLMG